MRARLLTACMLVCAGCSLDIEHLYGTHDAASTDGGGIDGAVDAGRDGGNDANAPDANVDAAQPDGGADSGSPDAGSDAAVDGGPATCVCASTALQLAATIPFADTVENVAGGTSSSGRGMVGASSHGTDQVHLLTLTRGVSCAVTSTVTSVGAITPGPLEIVDFDGDGFTDVVVATRTGSIGFAYGTLGGGITNAVNTTVGSVAAVAIDTPRIDGDTRRDLAFWEGGTDVHIYRQSAARTLTTLGGPSGSGITYRDGLLVDLDGNGVLDLTNLYATTSTTSVSVMLGSGTGTFLGPTSMPVASGAVHLAAGQFTGTRWTLLAVGGQEIAFAEYGTMLTVMRGSLMGADLRDVVVADIDGAAPPEIVVADAASMQLRILHWSPGTTSVTNVGSVPLAVTPQALAVVDVEGDGRDEIAVLASTQVLIFAQHCP